MKTRRVRRSALSFALLGAWITGCIGPNGATRAEARATLVVPAFEVQWEDLNPARGDQSPKAGTLWGDRNGTRATGFLLRPVDGFRSPPHLHNVSYRGVVIRGLLHNDDPEARDQWMPPGAFWTQPKGEVHITAAVGTDTLAYIEIEEGPYRVLPVEEEFDGNEVPINVDPSNLVWVDPPGNPASEDGPKVAYLWGQPGEGRWSGLFVRLPGGFTGAIHGHGEFLGAVVVQGSPELGTREGSTVLEPGSYFRSEGAATHRIEGSQDEACILYLRLEGAFSVTARK